MDARNAVVDGKIRPEIASTAASADTSAEPPARIVFLTEDEPLFTADALRAFFEAAGSEVDTALVVMTSFSPAGHRQGKWASFRQLWRGFGIAPLLWLALRYLYCRMHPAKRARPLLRRHGVRFLRTTQCVNSDLVLDHIRRARPDIILSASMNTLFKPALLRIAPCLNLHLSLLPRHKGLMPVFWALHDGDREAGATVFRVNGDVDCGEILAQRSVAIDDRRLIPLYGKLKIIGMAAMADAVRSFVDGDTKTPAAKKSAGRQGRRKPGIEHMRGFVAAGNGVI